MAVSKVAALPQQDTLHTASQASQQSEERRDGHDGRHQRACKHIEGAGAKLHGLIMMCGCQSRPCHTNVCTEQATERPSLHRIMIQPPLNRVVILSLDPTSSRRLYKRGSVLTSTAACAHALVDRPARLLASTGFVIQPIRPCTQQPLHPVPSSSNTELKMYQTWRRQQESIGSGEADPDEE